MLLALMAVSFGVLNACKEEIDNPDGEDDGHPSVTRITLDGNSPRAAMGLTLENMKGHTFKVGSSKVEPQRDGQGWYIDYVKEDYLKGVIMWEGASMPFSDRWDDENARIPFSQFHQTTLEIMKSYPLFARKDKNGNFKFKDAFAMLDLNITGSASINSIKVRRLDGGALSADGLDFVVLNCVMQEDGNPSSLPGHFMIPVKAGTYRGGLEITICDSNGGMRRMISDIPASGAGETLKLDMVYSPTPSVYFYAGFDNCVWGSDPYGLMQGYAPDSKDPGKDGRTHATGYEAAYESSKYAGTGHIQTKATEYEYAMSESYLKSRGFDKWKYMLRVKEFQGCVGVGVGNTSRGWVHTPVLSDIPEGSDVKLSFRFKVVTGADENIEIMCEGGGSFVGVILDSGLESKISGTSYVLDVEGLEEGWHDMSLVVTGASSQTSFRVGGNLKNSGVTHGFFIDDIYVRKVEGPMSDIPGISSLDQLSTVELSFKMKFDKYASEGLTISLPTGGFLCGMTVDSQPVADNVTGRTGWPLMTEVTLDPAGYYDQEHEVVLKIESADKDMTVLFKGDACSCSDMLVKKVSSIEKDPSFRLLLWNIQFGMWADQGNNYDNFVAWLKKYDADCCVFVEAETVYKDGSSEGEPAYLKKLNGSSGGTYGWSELAPRYGHSYMKVSADNDNYSQEITSNNRFLAVVSKLPGTFYGSGHFSINTGGRKINIVTYHGMPYNFDPKYKNASDAEKEESASKREGDVYRLNEVKYLVGQTFGNSNYSSEKNWIFLGDMNSHSPADNWYYGYISTGILAAQDYIIQSSGLRDVIAEKYPGRFLPTIVSGKFRIDYVYASDAMMSAVTNAVVIRDKWTSEKATAVDGFTHPSDHRPILVDFKF